MTVPVTIVGASLAGLYAAGELARAGRPVRLFEAHPALTFAPRTLIVTAELPHVLGFDPEEAVLNRIHHFELISRGASARISLGQPDLVVERGRLLGLLARRAAAAGAALYTAHPVQDLHWEGPGPVLVLESPHGRRQESAPRLLGAEGVHSVVADRMGLNHHPRVAILQARVPRLADCPPDTVRVWFDRTATRFFFWLIPESQATAVLGLIAENLPQAERLLQAFLRDLRLDPLEYQGTQVPLYPRHRRIRSRRGQADIFLAGDAAGQVKATTVGGAVAGLRGARAVVRAILAAGEGGPEEALLYRELWLHRLLRHLLDCFDDADYDALLAHLNGAGRALLAAHNRDRLTLAFSRLVACQPRWVGVTLRALARGRPKTRDGD